MATTGDKPSRPIGCCSDTSCFLCTAEPAAVTRDELLLVPDPFGIDAETALLSIEGYVEVLLNGCDLGGAGSEGAVTECWEVR